MLLVNQRCARKLQGKPKTGTMFYTLITSSNINRFSQFFYCQNLEKHL